jgi:hypothetical protein
MVRSDVYPKASHKNRAQLSALAIKLAPLICPYRAIDLDQMADPVKD